MICYLIIGIIVMVTVIVISGDFVKSIKSELSKTTESWWRRIGWILLYISAWLGFVWFWPFMISWVIKEVVQGE